MTRPLAMPTYPYMANDTGLYLHQTPASSAGGDIALPFDNSYAGLPERFYARLPPTPVAGPRLVKLNTALAAELGLDAGWLASPAGVEAEISETQAQGALRLPPPRAPARGDPGRAGDARDLPARRGPPPCRLEPRPRRPLPVLRRARRYRGAALARRSCDCPPLSGHC